MVYDNDSDNTGVSLTVVKEKLKSIDFNMDKLKEYISKLVEFNLLSETKKNHYSALA